MKVLIKDIVHIMCPWKETRKFSLMALLIKDIQKMVTKIQCSGQDCVFYKRGMLHTSICIVPI